MIQIAEERPTNGKALAPSFDLDPLRPLRSERLAIVGFSETTRGQAPFDDPSVEIWICNRLGLQPGIARWDRHFDPHPLAWSAINHKDEDWRTYKEFLGLDHGESLVYLPAKDEPVAVVPNAVAFPEAEIVANVGREYFTSVIGWQVGMALLLHSRFGTPKRLELYGIDLRGKAEYEFQRPNAEWLLGIAQGRGIEVAIPKESALLNSDARSPLYGLEIYSGFMGTMEKALEARIKELTGVIQKLNVENDDAMRELHTLNGMLQELDEWIEKLKSGAFEDITHLLSAMQSRRPHVDQSLSAGKRKNEQLVDGMNTHNGALQESDNWLTRVAQFRRGGLL